MKKTVILLAALLMSSIAAHAGFRTGNDVLAGCQSDRAIEQMYCVGYVDGVVGTLVIAAASYKVPRLVCVPDGVTTGQTVKVVERFLEAHPEELHKDARFLVYWALIDTWPCK